MIPASFAYLAPDSLDQALQSLVPEAAVVAGGHSLILELTERRLSPSLLIDLRRISALVGIDQTGQRLGAMTPLAQVTRHPAIRQHYTALVEAAACVGDVQIRNRAVIGDPYAFGTFAQDLSAALLALDARFIWATATGEVEMADLPTPRTEAILVAIAMPAPLGPSAYEVLPHAASRYPVCGVAAVLHPVNGDIETGRLVVTGMGITPHRLEAVEAALTGQPATPETIATAVAQATVTASSDSPVAADYLNHLVKVLSQRALSRVLQEVQP